MTDFNKNEVFVDHPYNDAEKLLEKKTGEKDGYNALEKLADGDGDLGYNIKNEKIVFFNGITLTSDHEDTWLYKTTDDNTPFDVYPDDITIEFDCNDQHYIINLLKSHRVTYFNDDLNVNILKNRVIVFLNSSTYQSLINYNLTNVRIYGFEEILTVDESFRKASFMGDGFMVKAHPALQNTIDTSYEDLEAAYDAGIPCYFLHKYDDKQFAKIRLFEESIQYEDNIYIKSYAGSYELVEHDDFNNELGTGDYRMYDNRRIRSWFVRIFRVPHTDNVMLSISNGYICGRIITLFITSSLPAHITPDRSGPWNYIANASNEYNSDDVILKIKKDTIEHPVYDAYHYAACETDLYENMGSGPSPYSPKNIHYLWFTNGIQKIKVTYTYNSNYAVSAIDIDYDES